MTKKKLEDYVSKKAEIEELQQKIAQLGEGDSLIDNDTILDYQTGYPRPQSVIGYNYNRERKLKNKWGKHIEELTADCLEVELWIEDIPDSLTRRIFRLCFIDNLNYETIGKRLHIDKSTVGRKINNFF